MRRRFAATALLLFVSLSATAHAQSPSNVTGLLANPSSRPATHPELDALERDLAQLERQPEVARVRTWIDTARGALDRARTLHAQGEAAAADRATQVANAAFAAATHILARHHAQAELEATRRRKQQAMAAAEATRNALIHAQSQRPSISETP